MATPLLFSMSELYENKIEATLSTILGMYCSQNEARWPC